MIYGKFNSAVPAHLHAQDMERNQKQLGKQCLLVPIRRKALVEAACPKPRADEVSWVSQSFGLRQWNRDNIQIMGIYLGILSICTYDRHILKSYRF